MTAKRATIAIAILATMSPALVGQATAQIPAPAGTTKEMPVAALTGMLDQAATEAEHVAETAIAKDAKQTSANLERLRNQLVHVQSRLAPATAAAIDAQVKRADEALKAADFTFVALAGAETYRALQESIDAKLRPVPLEVALLDYAGFKIEALSRATTIDWAQIDSTRTEAQDFWRRLEPQVASKGLKSTMATIFAGLGTGIDQREHRQVTFAARVLLDAVDLLEGPFKAASAK